jgi:hypothetical protein
LNARILAIHAQRWVPNPTISNNPSTASTGDRDIFLTRTESKGESTYQHIDGAVIGTLRFGNNAGHIG